MPATATIIRDPSPSATATRNVRVQWQDDDGVINVKTFRLSAGVDAQTWADSLAEKRSTTARQKEMEDAIQQCIAGTSPTDVVRVRITLPKLWEKITRRLHNGPRNGLDKDTMRGLAQWVVSRTNSAIRADLNNVRTNAEVNTLKAEWQALLAANITDFDEVEEE